MRLRRLALFVGSCFVFFGVQHAVFAGAGFFAVRTANAQVQSLTPDFYDSYDNGKSKGPVQQVGCGTYSFPASAAYRGAAGFRAESHNLNCINTNRPYPDYGPAYSVPALVTFWMKVDAPSWSAANGGRFSPLTVKEDPAQGTECNARYFTTQFQSDGSMGELGHSLSSFRATAANVKAPLGQWFLHSAYMETRNGQTYVTTWINNRVVVEGTTGNPFIANQIRTFHMGLYGSNNDMVVLNDEVKIFANLTGGVQRAAQLIAEELGSGYGPGDTQGQGATSLGKPGACYDGKDNDGDGRIDYQSDPECGCWLGDGEGVEGAAECADKIDNDNDGKIDLNDTGCTGVNDQVEHNNPSADYPVVDLEADPNNIDKGASSVLSWSTTNGASCTASGAWSGAKNLNGSQTVAPTQTTDYVLACTGSGGYRARLARVNINGPSGGPAPNPMPLPFPLPTPSPSPSPTPTPSPSPAPSPSPSPSPSAKFKIGDRVQTTAGLNV